MVSSCYVASENGRPGERKRLTHGPVKEKGCSVLLGHWTLENPEESVLSNQGSALNGAQFAAWLREQDVGLGAGQELGCAAAHPSDGPIPKIQAAWSGFVSLLSPISTGAAASSCRKGHGLSNPHEEKPCQMKGLILPQGMNLLPPSVRTAWSPDTQARRLTPRRQARNLHSWPSPFIRRQTPSSLQR